MKKNNSLLLVLSLFVLGSLVIGLSSAGNFFSFFSKTSTQNTVDVPQAEPRDHLLATSQAQGSVIDLAYSSVVPVKDAVTANEGKSGTIDFQIDDRSWHVVEYINLTMLGKGVLNGKNYVSLKVGRIDLKLFKDQPLVLYSGRDGIELRATYLGDTRGGAKIRFERKLSSGDASRIMYMLPAGARFFTEDGAGIRFRRQTYVEDEDIDFRLAGTFYALRFNDLSRAGGVFEDGEEDTFPGMDNLVEGDYFKDLDTRGNPLSGLTLVGIVAEGIMPAGGGYIKPRDSALVAYKTDKAVVLSANPPNNNLRIVLKAFVIASTGGGSWHGSRNIKYRMLRLNAYDVSKSDVYAVDEFEVRDDISSSVPILKGYLSDFRYLNDYDADFFDGSKKKVYQFKLRISHPKRNYPIVGTNGLGHSCFHACQAEGFAGAALAFRTEWNSDWDRRESGKSLYRVDPEYKIGKSNYALICYCG